MLDAQIITPPAVEPISLEEAKLHLRVDHPNEDLLIAEMITGAREWIETYTRRSLITQTLRLWLSGFPSDNSPIILPGGPVQSITSVVYFDPDGNSAAMLDSSYALDAYDQSRHSQLTLAPGIPVWPLARAAANQVQITYVAGFGATGASVPATLRTAMRVHVGWSYQHREPTDRDGLSQLERALERMLAPHRLHGL